MSVQKGNFGPYRRVMSTCHIYVVICFSIGSSSVISSVADLFDQIELSGRIPPRSDHGWVSKDATDDFE